MIEFIVQIIGEFIVQIIAEALFAFGYRSLSETFRKQRNPWLAALGFSLFGAILGGLSLLVLPSNLTPVGMPRVANLVFTPLLVGFCMSAIGGWRAKRGRLVLPIDRFWYGYLFALAVALIRFKFAR
ncbi:hypothetical protein [Chamaesiphon sp. VAR_48_metabat_403]|uniref:hypothetical protein n=1 Tax=Chamaesiphon sp. VAR_48_metabat_403 TaxID=2964700 RepID=UPI00286E9E52|nr:hypothetical protein [Chamaesiphon sp. VAR_48_metabat_403]